MDLGTLYARTVEGWAERVNAVPADRWDDPTPCRAWSVRDLVNHVCSEDRWTAPLVEGATVEDVGDRFDGDLLGKDPISSALAAAAEATRAVAQQLPEHRPVHLSYGEEQLDEYLLQLAADHLIHGWDLAVATGGDPRLDPALVAEVSRWFAEREEIYRSVGAVGPRGVSHGDAQGELLAGAGRDADWGPNHAALARFSAAFGAGDIEAIMALMTDDCVFESTEPPPDGERFEGAEAVRGVWVELFGSTAGAAFDEEEALVCGDRGVLRWRFEWTGQGGVEEHVRGVDVLRFRGGKVAEKLSYVKG